MDKNVIRALAAALAITVCASLTAAPAQASVSDKQPLAIFALGYYGYDIPDEALGSVDARIMEVFTQMKRFSIIGFEQRFTSADVSQFIQDLKKIKEANLVIPEKYLLGEAFLTEAEMNKLIGAFYIVMPVVTDFSLKYLPADKAKGTKASWKCSIDVSVTFQDVAQGVTMSAPVISASGTSALSREEAAMSAIDSLPGQMEIIARKVFPLDSKIVSSTFSSVKMRLGANMGIKKGYEFAVIDKQDIDGVIDERECGLVVVRSVTSEFSDATILYSSIPLQKETQLREIPRGGSDLAAYCSVLYGISPALSGSANETIYAAPGLKATVSEGFYDLKPFVGIQTYIPGIAVSGSFSLVPITVYFGGEYNLYLRRIQLYPFIAVGGSGYYYKRAIDDEANSRFLSHLGGMGGVGFSYLVTKNFKVYAEANGQYWQTLFSVGVDSFMGAGATIGITAKL
jgi:hypothetical protein